jgi:hypothetical protein
MVEVPDDAVTITDDTVTVSLKDVPVVDQFQFPFGAGNNLGIAGSPAKVSFDITYTKSGMPRHVRSTSADPLSPFNWAGEMWTATNSGTFSIAYNDGSLLVLPGNGSFSSSGNFGEMGTERNGSFVREGDRDADRQMLLPFAQNQPNATPSQWVTGAQSAATAALATNSPKFKGRVPLKVLIH